jgi:uncharacterized membrane protein YhaH (DUF805 family)
MFDFTLHVGIICYFLFHKHVLVVFLFYCFQQEKQKEFGGKDAEFFFFFYIAFQILYVFLPDISVHSALIEYAYI